MTIPFTDVRNNFSGGIFSPLLSERDDLDRYGTSFADGLNVIVLKYGPLLKRSGTKFSKEVKDSSKTTILYEFEYSTTASYVLEIGDLYIRVYKNGSIIESSPSVALEIVTPFPHTEIANYTFTQSADFLYIFSGTRPIYTLTRSSDTSWTLTKELEFDGPYLLENVTGITLTPTATTGNIQINASSALFASTDVDRLVRIKQSTTWGYAKITAFNSTTQVDATVINAFLNTTAVATWRLGAWSTDLGWPKVGEFHNERLCVGANIAQPNTVWFGETGIFSSFAPSDTDGTVSAAHAFSKTLGADKVNAIQWLKSGKFLHAGTKDGVWSIFSGKSDEGISDSNAKAEKETANGSNGVQPVHLDKSIMFVSRSGTRMREIVFNLEQDGFISPDLTVFSEHLSLDGIKEIRYTEEPHQLVWARMGDDMVVALTFDKDQSINGMHVHKIKGTDVQIKSMATVPSEDEKRNELYLLVSRTVDGSTVQYVEILQPPFRLSSSMTAEDAFFVDSGIIYSGVATDTITGLDHLNGESISLWVNGAVHPNRTVSGGQVTLDDDSYTKVIAGLGFPCHIKTLVPRPELPSDVSNGLKMRIHDVDIKFFESLGGQIGDVEDFDADNMEDLDVRSTEDLMDTGVPLHSEWVNVDFDSDWSKFPQFVLKQDIPAPFSVQAIVMRGQVGEESGD